MGPRIGDGPSGGAGDLGDQAVIVVDSPGGVGGCDGQSLCGVDDADVDLLPGNDLRAATILDRLGVTREKVREASTRLFEPALIAGPGGGQRRVVGDGEAGQAVTGARRLAAGRGQSQFRTEHLLFCLALDPGSSARRVLNDLGVDPAQVKKELQEWVGPVQRRRRRIGKDKGAGRACSFCGCTNLGPLVAGPGVWICGNCALTALEILRDEPPGLSTG